MDVDFGASSASQQPSRSGSSKAKAQKAVVEQRRALVWARVAAGLGLGQRLGLRSGQGQGRGGRLGARLAAGLGLGQRLGLRSGQGQGRGGGCLS